MIVSSRHDSIRNPFCGTSFVHKQNAYKVEIEGLKFTKYIYSIQENEIISFGDILSSRRALVKGNLNMDMANVVKKYI